MTLRCVAVKISLTDSKLLIAASALSRIALSGLNEACKACVRLSEVNDIKGGCQVFSPISLLHLINISSFEISRNYIYLTGRRVFVLPIKTL